MCHKEANISQKSISQTSFSRVKEESTAKANDQPEEVEHIYSKKYFRMKETENRQPLFEIRLQQ